MLVYSAADFEDFRVERPEMPPNMEGDLEPVVRVLGKEQLAVADCTPHTTKRSHTRSMSSKRSIGIFRSTN